MVLLDPSVIKDEKKQRETESQSRIAALGVEEAAANRRVNDILEREKQEKARIQAEAEQGVPELLSKKSTLTDEVVALELRKETALQPVKKLKAQAEAQLKENIAQGELIKEKSAQLDRDSEIIVERTEALDELEQVNAETKKKLDKRAIGIATAEENLKQGNIALSEKWVEFHKTVAQKNQELQDREQRVKSDTRANEVFAAQLSKTEAEQHAQHRAIADKYATLGRAVKEFERKKNGKR